jgi:hypothetical protein
MRCLSTARVRLAPHRPTTLGDCLRVLGRAHLAARGGYQENETWPEQTVLGRPHGAHPKKCGARVGHRTSLIHRPDPLFLRNPRQEILLLLLLLLLLPLPLQRQLLSSMRRPARRDDRNGKQGHNHHARMR